jgi:hypothetical protein
LRIVPIIVFLVIIKVVAPQLFDSLLQKRVSYDDVISKLNLHDLGEDGEYNRRLYWIMQWLRYSLLSEKEFNALSEDDEIKGFGQFLLRYNVSRERLIPIFAQQLNMFVVT